ncbi:hypothetical protein SS05631_b57150 (plasmid) [Sinorhizobium sp. CCBAU 05631]|nr:hypothetical protein SS05631_b57150 [Sinorhizobium sp. CCBAU 05631]
MAAIALTQPLAMAPHPHRTARKITLLLLNDDDFALYRPP